MFLGGVGFHDTSGRRAPRWCEVTWSDTRVLLSIPARMCQTWHSLVFSLVQHAITEHNGALLTHCSRNGYHNGHDSKFSNPFFDFKVPLLAMKTSYLLIYDAVQPGESRQTFRNNTSRICSGSNILQPSSCWFLVCLLTNWPWLLMLFVLPKRRLSFSTLHRIISQKTEFETLCLFPPWVWEISYLYDYVQGKQDTGYRLWIFFLINVPQLV
jgi:hypothetical protein